ncbi:hypothetical protein J6590_075404 [Homalodisca vitripennis]|nr:hypothetical protein J6590_075404 [Homalodisca vitripennis]
MEPDLAYTPVTRRPTRDAEHPQPDRKIFQTARQADAEHKWPSFGKRGRGEWKRRHDTLQVEDPASQQPQKATLMIRSNTKKDVTARKEIRTVPIVRELVDELVAIGQIENAEGNLPKGYLAVLGCDILGQGNGEISVGRGVLRLLGKDIWLNRLRKGKTVPDPIRSDERSTQPKTQRYVYCCNEVKIPPRCEKIIRVKTSRFTTKPDELEGAEVMIEPGEFVMHGV